METTESSNQRLTVESATDLLVQQEDQPETAEEVVEAEVEQPEEDFADDAEDLEEDEVEDVDESEVEEVDDEEADEDYEDVEEDEPDQDGPTLYTVKVDGEEQQVTLDDLKRGYSGQQYVQKGMQQAAEARKQAEQVFQALSQDRQNLAALVQQLQAGDLSPPQEPSREMFDADPIGYMEAKMNYDEQLKAYNENQSKVQEQLQAQTASEERAMAAYAQQEAQRLVEMVPELRDAKKASAFKEKIVRTATEVYGYEPAEIESIRRAKDFQVLIDAMRYREIVSKGDVVKAKAKKARPAIKPGAKKVSTKGDVARKQRAQLRKTGSLQDALSMMLES